MVVVGHRAESRKVQLVPGNIRFIENMYTYRELVRMAALDRVYLGFSKASSGLRSVCKRKELVPTIR